jgi:hypothetical protein
MRIKILIAWLSILLLLINSNTSSGSGSIIRTKHNLSVSGDGSIKSTSETRVCIFCHSSHNASSEGPLWNHKTTSSGKFQTYKRSTMVSNPEQPNGSTKLCLSCHDGTIAVGAIRGRAVPIPMKNVTVSGKIPVSRKSHIGTDLRGSHPVSVKFDQRVALTNKSLKWPISDPEQAVGTDHNGYVQCTSCHDPHDDSKSDKYPFWKKPTFSEVCKACHKY